MSASVALQPNMHVERSLSRTKSLDKSNEKFCGSPIMWLLLAILAGFSFGMVLSNQGMGKHDMVTFLALPGKLWLKGLKCIVLPMIVFSMIGAMIMLRSLPGAKFIGMMVVGCYLCTTVVAAIEGCVAAGVILGHSVHQMENGVADTVTVKPDIKELTLTETIILMVDNLVPKNLINDPATNNLLPVIISSIIFGMLVEDKDEDGKESVVIRMVNELNRVVVKVVTILMSLTPIGVGSLVFKSAASLDLAKVGADVGYLMLAVISGLLFHALVFYPTLLFLVAGRNPITYYSNLVPAFATALGTSSSAATLPVSVNLAVKRNGIQKHIADFVLALGATINMDGTTIYLICATYFLSALHGVQFDAGKYMLTVLLATLCSMGTAPVPSASLVLLATILTAVGTPLDETFGLITAVDWMLDRLRTVVNVAGDAAVTAVVDGQTRGKELEDSSDSESEV